MPSSQNQKVQRSSVGAPNPPQPIGTPVPNAPQLHQPTLPANQVGSFRTSDVHLCVEAGSRQFKTLDCTDLRTDIEFFNTIKSEYNDARGWFLLWFSTWIYHYCDFFLFQKHAINASARLEIGFPDATDLGYDLSPRPPETQPPHGPISHDEFNFHYYLDVCPSYLSWTRWFASYFTDTGASTASRTALDAAPKRTSELQKEDGKRELFYGIYAREERSALRVVIYISLCNIPGVIFFLFVAVSMGSWI
jgi:hypothetical protein